MSQHGLSQGGKSAVVEIRRFIGTPPQTFGEKLPIALAKLSGPYRLVHIQRFCFRGIIRVANVVQFEIRIRWDVQPFCVSTRRG